MRTPNFRLLAIAGPALLATACSAAPSEAQVSESPAASTTDADALALALEDEYRAEAIYEAVMTAHGQVRPFSNIIEAEKRHSARVREEMTRLGIEYTDTNPFLGKVTAPAVLLEACQQGVDAEIENIALYEEILPTIADKQVKATLTDLQWASRERHLPAFQRCVDRGGEPGRGSGHGGGYGRKN